MQLPLGKQSTVQITKALAEVNLTCGSQILWKYRIDCIRTQYLELARAMPDTVDYAAVKAALLDGAAKLGTIVAENADPEAPRIRAPKRAKPDAPRTPPLRAIAPDAQASAQAEAEAVIREVSLVILRSGEDPSRREPHYTDVAAAVDSNLLILRSA